MPLRVLVLFCIGWTLVGCEAGRATPSGPSPIDGRALLTPPPQSGYWSLTTTLTAIAGPEVCFDQREALGRSTHWWLDVRRAGSAIVLVLDVRHPAGDQIALSGMTDGMMFEARTTGRGQHPCGGAPVAYELETRVTGGISADGRILDASERVTYLLESGQSVVLLYAWHAERA